MRKFAKCLIAIAVLLGIPLSGQITIGPWSLASPAAPILRASLAEGFSAAFLARVGGVAFDQKALPVPGFAPHSIALKYIPERLDGQRVVAEIDGQQIQVNLYDWQLMPIARFAQSTDTAVFTLFGHLQDRQQEGEILEAGGHVVNYHRAFSNTLLGLRMLQLDTLLAGGGDDLAIDLPKERGKYILGPGEHAPDLASNRVALTHYRSTVKVGVETDAAHFGSYVVGDRGRESRFEVQQGTLRITGEPGYYFWRYNGAEAATMAEIRSKAKKEIRVATIAAKKQQGVGVEEQVWLVQQVTAAIRQASGGPTELDSMLPLLSAAELNEIWEDAVIEKISQQPAYMKVVHLETLSNFVNERIEIVRDINPTVWDAATTVMRYSAFFRYCRENDPAAWQAFLGRVSTLAIRPVVKTPTVLQLASAPSRVFGGR